MERPTVHPQAGDPAGTSSASMRGVGIDLAAELVQNPQENSTRRSGGGPMSSGSPRPLVGPRHGKVAFLTCLPERFATGPRREPSCRAVGGPGLGLEIGKQTAGTRTDRWLELRPLHSPAERSLGRRPFCICRRRPAPRSRVTVAGTVEPPEPDRAAHQADQTPNRTTPPPAVPEDPRLHRERADRPGVRRQP